MELNRKLTKSEELLLEVLVKKSSLSFPLDWKENLLVRPMDDGGMGSLLLFPRGLMNEKRMMGTRISECRFLDKDGIEVIASLNIDDKGDLYELDVWKTDFSPLISFPSSTKDINLDDIPAQ
jgi:hypothetical protein